MAKKPIAGFEKYYEITDDGKVFRLGSNRPRKPQKTHKGYLKVFLYKPSGAKAFFVHRLVAKAFLPMRRGRIMINHKDGDKTNNHVNNLEWCSVAENNAHAKAHGLYRPNRGSKHGMSHLSDEDVRELREKKMRVKDLAAKFGIHRTTVRRIINRELWTHI